MTDLETALLAAHDAGDHRSLVGLYVRAAEEADGPAIPFFLTQAWIFALETGDARARPLETRLRDMGCA
ncbi:MAG: hypothetical protein WBA67_02880 [Jannaschia sp.]